MYAIMIHDGDEDTWDGILYDTFLDALREYLTLWPGCTALFLDVVGGSDAIIRG